MTEVAVVILNYNGKHFLQQFLPSVITYSKEAAIIVADNCSTDDSISFLEKEYPGVGIIRIPSNLGFCGGYNFALKKVEATYYVLLNSDVEVTEGWLGSISAMRADASIAACQPKILSYYERNKFEYAGAAGGFIDMLGYPFCQGRIFNYTETDNGQYNTSREVFWATGACMFVRAHLYHQMNGLDEDFFAHMEEIDLCWKLNRAGYKVYYHSESKVYHVGGGTLPVANPRKTYYNFRNGLSLLFKHTKGRELLWKFPLRIALDWVAALKFLIQPSPKDCFAVMKAHASFAGSISRQVGKRRSLKKQLTNFNVTHVYNKPIIIDFFLRDKKTFRDIML